MTVLVEVADYVATITLNRPEAMNSIDQEMRQELNRLWQQIHTDEAIRVAILTGAGEKALCAGADLKMMPPSQTIYNVRAGIAWRH